MMRAKKIAVSLLILSFVAIVFGLHVFPFSDYYMFSGVQKGLIVHQLLIHRSDGTEKVLDNDFLKPFNRLHINHMIFSIHAEQRDFNWVRHFYEKAKEEDSQVRELTVERITFAIESDQFKLTPVKRQVIFRWPQ